MKLFEVGERSILSVYGQQPSHMNRNFKCHSKGLTSLVGSPQSVSGDFDCSDNYLTSLAGGPQSVGRDFHCTDNKLTTLEHCPQYVGVHFVCNTNRITSLHNIHKMVKQMNGEFWCDKATHMLGLALIKGITKVVISNDNNLRRIFDEHLRDINLLQDALIDAGYKEQARL